eukprot:942575-Ditylum_brightwellii.AAC.1
MFEDDIHVERTSKLQESAIVDDMMVPYDEKSTVMTTPATGMTQRTPLAERKSIGGDFSSPPPFPALSPIQPDIDNEDDDDYLSENKENISRC